MENITGVSFDGVHSYKDWGLKIKSMKIGFPDVKDSYVDVPGMNGLLDLTEVQNTNIVYGMRTLEFVFDARNCSYKDWPRLISKIGEAIHGRKKKIELDIDPSYSYEGRCSIDTAKTNEIAAEISITCSCYPYKIVNYTDGDEWLWDPFSFVDGFIRKSIWIDIKNAPEWTIVSIKGWPYNEPLRIQATSAMKLKYKEITYDLVKGINMMTQFDIVEGINELQFQGSGSVLITQRGGML